MKPVRRVDSSSQSCSCTSCLYKSESEQPSIRKYVAHGSRIDRLYYGKYIPLRERKLLDRLVRTRAVYDDLRARLISDSTLSLEKNADLRPGKHHRIIKPVDSEKSGAILELVDIIDKGAALGPKKLSECCSCCSCSSKSKILEPHKKEKRGKKVYTRTHEEEYGVKGQTGTGEGVFSKTYKKKHGKMGQTGLGEEVYKKTYEKRHGKTGQTGTGAGEYATYEKYEREFGKKVPIPGRYNKRGVRFKAKRIRSDPCTCTFKFSGLIKTHSKAIFKKVHPSPLDKLLLNTEEQKVVEKAKKKSFARKSLQKYKDLRDKLEQDIRKLNESKVNMKQNLQLRAKKSLEQGKQIKNKIKQNIETGVRRSIQAVKDLQPKEKVEPVEYPEEEGTAFKIKKDSIVKFKDHLKRKELMKDWECDLECEPDICVPEECFKIIKLKKLHKRSRQRNRKLAAGYEMINKEVKIGGIPISRSSSGVQAKQRAITTATHVKKQKPMLRADTQVHKGDRTKGENENVKKVDKPSIMTASPERAFRDVKKKDFLETKNENLKERGLIINKHPSRGRQAVRIKSSVSFDIEFYKNRPESKLSRSSQPSGIHVHAPRRKHRKVHRHHESIAVSKSSLESSQGTPENLKTRLIQTDKHGKAPIPSQHSQQRQLLSKISQCECAKRLSNVQTNTNYGTKSVSSVTNNVTTIDKNISKEVKRKGRSSQVSFLTTGQLDTLPPVINESNSQHKQAVRIGSTFSFSIEFYKKGKEDLPKAPKSPHSQKSLSSIKKTKTHTRNKHGQVRRRLVQVKGTSTKAYKHAKTTLHRCFCTMKLNKHVKTKKKEPGPVMIDKFVETKKNYRYELPMVYDLLPYECEPGICIPGECDPILCKKIIDSRQHKFRGRITKSTGSYTDSRKTKSTSSIVSKPFTSAKTVQSSIVSTKVGRTGAPRRYKNNFNMARKNKQAVRIGSSFSFNIEFYKETPDLGGAITNKPSVSIMPSEFIYKEQKFKDQRKNKRNKSMFTQVMKMDKYIGPSLKNCLCTLKLYKNKIPKTKELKKNKNLTTNTQTFAEAPIRQSVDRGTRTKKKHHYKLLPYECEPYTCVPGECDPYICLQNIKRRQINTRNISAYTDKPDMRSMSSITESSFKKSEVTLVQPKLFPKGTNMKANHFKALEGRSRSTGESFDKASKSKQAVRIGSSFKFNIEFSKQSPGPVMLTKYPKIKQSPNGYKKMNRDRAITVTKVRVNHDDTQSREPRKVNRASLVRPMLKRCFCTLNLQKKIKQQYRKGKQETEYFGPKVYTVGRATTTKTEIISQSFGSQTNAKLQFTKPKTKIISVSTSSFLLTKYVRGLKSKHEMVKSYSTFKIPNQSTNPAVIKSNLSVKINFIEQVLPCKQSWERYIKEPLKTFSRDYIGEKSYKYLKRFNQPSDQKLRKITGISRYLERCFCTMNVRISNPVVKPGIKKISHKLKPYECEPGICIPGECDPYECKKLIMKRFTKNMHKGSDTTSKSISRYTSSNTGSNSRSTRMQTQLQSHSRVTVPQKHKRKPEIHTQSLREAKQKQAVRLKSSFSFDLEFYKHRSQPFEKYVNQDKIGANLKKPISQKTYDTNNKGTQENKIHGKDRKFQSTVTSLHKGTASMTKRCFCTLKLQKKGRIHKEFAKLNRIPAKQLPSITSRNVKIGTTAKNHIKPVDLNDLKFYECEPGICVPGQCDPYNCLELMKHRKNFGINTVQKQMNSVPSMTTEEEYKTRAVGATPVAKHHKSTKSINYFKDIQNDKDIKHISGHSVRPAVRIGSSFSFNIIYGFR